MACSHPDASVTSSRTVSTSTPASAAALATTSALAWERTEPMERKPLRASSITVARPMPELAPVPELVDLARRQGQGPRLGRGPLRHHHDRGEAALLVPALEAVAHLVDVEGLLRDEDLRRPPGDPRVGGDPARVPAHDLAHD